MHRARTLCSRSWPGIVILSLLASLLGATAHAAPKNVIILIGDGMGFEQVKAAGIFKNGVEGTLTFEGLPYKGAATTYSANDSVTDSAASGTAIATGVKVNNDVVSVALPGDGSDLETLLEYFKARAKMTGLVTTAYVTHATPAAFGAHETSRNNYSQIAEDYLLRSRPNVLFGGASYIGAADQHGYTEVFDRAGLLALDTGTAQYVSGQFGSGYMPYEYYASGAPVLSVTFVSGEQHVTLTFSGPTETADAQITADSPNTNDGSATSIKVDGLSPHAHAVMKFPSLIGIGPRQVPSGATIVSARLQVNVTNPGNSMTLYRLGESWDEASVTWNSSSSGVAWSSPGAGGAESHEGDPITVSAAAAGLQDYDMTQFVQAWAAGEPNHGLVFLDGGDDGVAFDASESSDPYAVLPHLTEMTRVALDMLEDDLDGFFLMVEGGRIDHACHDNLLKECIHETIEFENAFDAVMEWAEGRNDTLVIVTADHETGGLTVIANHGAGVYPTVTWSTTGHTGADVPVYAWGPGADQVAGVIDNTDFFGIAAPGRTTDPVALSDAYETVEGALLVVDAPGVLGNDSDPNSDPLTAVLDLGVMHGSLSLSAGGSFTYAPTLGFVGTDSFTYYATDGTNHSSPATVTIAVERDITADDDLYIMAPGSTLTVPAPGVLANDIDRTGDPLEAVLQDAPASGSLAFQGDGSFAYTPDSGFVGTDSFTYYATDGTSSSATATVAIAVASEVTVSFQEGVSGYAGTVDTYLAESSPTTSYASATSLLADTDEPSGSGKATQVLLRFESIVGQGADRIPPGAEILSATLTLHTSNSSNAGATVHRMLQTWADTATWNGLVGGVQANDVEAMASADVATGAVATGTTVLDVRSGVQAWVDGQDNEGWAFLPVGTDGWDFDSSEGSVPPILTVTRSTVAPPAAPANLQATAGAGQIVLDWDDSAEPSLAGYHVFRSDVEGGPYDLIDGDWEETLQATPIAAGTGEKPQSKVWRYGGEWWCVLADGTGTWLRRLDGLSWTSVLQLSPKTTVKADCKAVGGVTHVLLYDGSSTQLASVEYVSGEPGSYQLWSSRQGLVNIALPSGVETATVDVDSTGRMWLASNATDTTSRIEVRHADFPYASWYGPVILATGVHSDDICVLTALPDGTVGVLWSDQVTRRFGFRVHLDGNDPSDWGADEVPASGSALAVGGGMADDHLNVAVAGDGTLYAAVKTSYDASGYPKVALLVRRAGGVWDPLHEVDQSGTRPIVLLDEARSRLFVFYTQSEGYNDIVYRESDSTSILFGSQQTFLEGAYNDVSSMKENIGNDLVVIASSSAAAVGKYLAFAAGDPLASTYTDTGVVAGQTYYYVVTAVNGFGQESLPSLEASAAPGLPLPPAAPSGLVAIAISSSQIGLTWVDNADDEVGFEVERSLDGEAWGWIATAGANETTSTDAGLASNTLYRYRVRAFSAGGYSDYSGVAAATTLQVNLPPVAHDDSYEVDEDTTLVVPAALGVLANDDDANGDTLRASLVLGPRNGDLFLDPADGSFTYTPDPDFAGEDSFTYQADDGQEWSEPATVRITVMGTDDAPTVPQDVAATAGAGTVSISWTSSTDPDSDLYGYKVYRTMESGGYDFGNPTAFAFVEHPETTYADSGVQNDVTYFYVVRAVDRTGLESAESGEVSATPSDTLHDAYVVANPAVPFGVLGGGFEATFAADDASVQTIVEAPNGVAGASSLDAVYTLQTTAVPAESITTLVLHLKAAWTGADGAADPLVVWIWNVSTQAWDGEALAGILASESSDLSGSPGAYVDASGTIRVRFTDTAAIRKETKDTVTIDLLYAHVSMASPNESPVAADDAYSTAEDTPLSAVVDDGVLANDTDAEGDPLTAVLVAVPANGSLVLDADGSFTYTPDPDFNGLDSFTYRASDGTSQSNLATVTIAVNPVNDAPPVAVDDAYETEQDAALIVTDVEGVLANDTDIDGDELTAAVLTGPSNGSLTLNDDGSFTYTPPAGFYGEDSFTYKANDGTADSAPATVTITVTKANAPPVAANDAYSTDEDTPLIIAAPGVLGNDSDADPDPLTAVLVSGVGHGLLTLSANGSFTYTPDLDFNGPDSFTYRASDGMSQSGEATVTITVGPVNDAPVAADDGYEMLQDTQLIITAEEGVLGNDTDVDGDPLTAVLVSDVEHGSLTLNADGSFTYTPEVDFHGQDSFTYAANDTTENSPPATVTITVTKVNAPPVAVADSYSTAEDTPLAVSAALGVLANDTDADGDPLTAALVSGVSHGSLTLSADGSFTYTPDPDFNGSDSFTYRASDGTSQSGEATVTIAVSPVNDAPPVAVDDAYTTAQDTPLTVAAPGVLGNDTDVDGDPLTAVLVSDVAHGTLALSGGGSFTYTPEAGFTGTDSFTYKASDGTLESNTATVTITVTGGTQTISVADIAMRLVPAGKNTKGEARVTVSPAIAGATVTGDWLLNGAPLVSGTSGVTDGSGVAVISSTPIKVGSGDTFTFTFTVTGIAADGYDYAPEDNVQTTATIP